MSTMILREGAPASAPAWGALAAVLAGLFMSTLDFFIVNVAMPSIQRDLGATSAGIQLIIARLCAGIRIRPDYRGAAWRHDWPPPDVHSFHGVLHAGLRRLRPGSKRRVPAGGPYSPGTCRGVHGSPGPGNNRNSLHRRCARSRYQRVWHDHGSGCGLWPAPWRPSHQAGPFRAGLAPVLPGQRSNWRRCPFPEPQAHRGIAVTLTPTAGRDGGGPCDPVPAGRCPAAH